MAQGFKQEYGIDYKETFAPVSKMATVRTLLGTATARNWLLWHMDVKNSVLHGDLHENVHMRPPPGYICPPNMLCQLKKTLYGLKRVPVWQVSGGYH